MLGATQGPVSAPQAQRKSLLGSARAQGQHQHHHYANGNGGGGGGGREAQPHASTSSGSGGGRATVPQKRRLGGAGGGRAPEKRRRAELGPDGDGAEGQQDDSEIRCLCKVSADDGFSIACDMCGRWAHAACVGVQREAVPEEWACWACAPERYPPGTGTTSSKRRRGSVSGRRAGEVLAAAAVGSTSPTPGVTALDEAALEDERTQYVLIDDDVVPHPSTQHKLRAYAAQWRGVSALAPPPGVPPHQHTPFVFPRAPAPHPTTLRALAAAPARQILPPTFGLHAAAPARPRALLARFPALITPSAAYLAAPANGYAHAGVPRRFVHLVGPPLDVALDARGVGGRARWVRSGCWPNAELRAYVCGGGDGAGWEGREGRGYERRGERDGVRTEEAARTHFGIFATRALRAGEEIVLGWEWDDGNAVHRVGEVAEGLPTHPTPAQRHLVAQLANILHALGDARCACAEAGAAPKSTHVHPHPPSKPAHTHPNSNSKSAHPAAPVAAKEEDMSGEGELDDKEKGCVLAAMEQVVFPPPPPPPASIHALRHVSMYGDTAYSDMEMEVDVEGEGDADVDIDVVGEDGLSPAATRLALPTPRIPISAASGLVSGSSSSAAPSSSAPRTSSSAASSSRVPSSSVSASGSTSTSATALKKKPKRLAGPGVPPPSPEAPTGVSAYTQHALVQPALHLAPRAAYTQTKPAVHAPNGHPQTSQNGQRWGPLIGAVRGVRAAEAEWGSGGWGGVVLADGYADEDASMRGANPHASTNGGNARASSSSKPYAVVERAGGWDISHSREREEGEDGDVDVVGDGDDTHPSARSRGKSRHQDQQYDRDAAREGTCPPKMRRRWTQGTRGTDPPRTMDKDKGKARVEAMDIGEVTDAGLPPSLARTHGHTYAVASAQSQVPQPAPAPPSPVPPPAASLPALPLSPGTSPSASFARLSLVSPHPGAGGPRPAWVAGVSIRGWEVERAGVVDVEPSGAGADAAIQRQDDTVPPPPADEGTPSHPLPPVADGMPPPGAPLPPSPVAARPSPSPRVRFIEPSPPPEADPSNSPSHEHDDDDVPFMDVPADEPYRPSPASPSPAPESEDEMEEEPAPTIAPVLPVLEVSFSREEASAPVERGASAPIETASLQREASAPAETPMEREMSVAVGDASSAPAADVSPVDVVLDIPSPPPPTPPSPAPPPPVQVKKSIKEWRKEREANKALEDERQRERERERRETESEREREREPEKEKDEQGADKENEVVPPLPPAKPEDALARVLDDIRRDAMSEKPQPPPVHTQVQEDVEMPDTAPPMPLLPPPTATKPRLKMEPFVPTGTHGGLSPLTTSSAAGSRTPSPGLANGASLVKRETSPLAVNVPAMLNGESRPTTSSSSLKPQSSFVKTTALLPPRQHVLQSPKAPRYPSPSFTSNGVSKAAPPPPPKPLPVSAQTSSPSFATNGGYRPTKPSSFSPAQSSPASQWASSSNGIARSPFSPRPATPTFKHHARIPSQEEGEILGASPPPPMLTPVSAPARATPFVFGTQSPFTAPPSSTPSVPPTQPRSYQAQRAPPSAPKALREAQNPNAIASSSSSGGSGGGGRGGRFGGLAPQTIPQSVLEPPRERSNRRGHHNRKRR